MKKKKIILIFFIFLIFSSFVFIIPAFAKYLIEQGKQSEITSEDFYFSSDYLKDDDIVPEYRIYGSLVTFEVRNYIDSLRVYDKDINYVVTTSSGNIDINSGTFSANTSQTDIISLSYSFEEDEYQKEIIVTARSTFPYIKDLKAKFIFIKQTYKYKIEDAENYYYAQLYIYAGDNTLNVTINWDKSKLLIDETNYFVFGKLNEDKNSVTIDNIKENTVIMIIFFKKDISLNYSCGETIFENTINIG